MSTETAQRHKQRLLAFRNELLNEGDEAFEPESAGDDTARRVDEDAAPLAEMNQVIASNRNRERAKRLREIDAALLRLSKNPEDFGLCEECDEPIKPRRLELMPWVRLCIDCQGGREDDGPGTRRRHLTDYR